MERSSEEPPDRESVGGVRALVHPDSLYFTVGFIALAAGGFAFLGVLLLMIAITHCGGQVPGDRGILCLCKICPRRSSGIYLSVAARPRSMMGYAIDAAEVLSRVFALPINEVALLYYSRSGH